MVEDEGDADDRHAPREGALELEAKPPALRCRGLEQRVRTGGAQNLLAGRADERGRPAVQNGLGCRHDDDHVGACERRMHAQGDRARAADVHEILALDVMHLDVTVEAARKLRRDQRLEPIAARAPREPAGDEQCLVARWNSQPLELRNCGGDRGMSRIPLDARNGKGRWLDDDRRARTTGHDCLEWLAGEREAQRVAHRCADIGDGVAGWRRPQHERVVLGGHDHEPRAGQQRNAFHGTCR